MTSGNVLPITDGASEFAPISRSLFGRPTKATYKAAVARVIRKVKADNDLTNIRLAEILACDEKTIRNAESEDNGCLDPVILMNLGYAYGEAALEPVRQLYLCAGVEPLTPAERIARATREIIAATAELEAR